MRRVLAAWFVFPCAKLTLFDTGVDSEMTEWAHATARSALGSRETVGLAGRKAAHRP